MICKSFSKHTGLGADSWHPRWWSWLTEAGQEAFVVFINYVGKQVQWPAQVECVVYFLIPKETGGLRPIGLLTTIMRVVERVQRGSSLSKSSTTSSRQSWKSCSLHAWRRSEVLRRSISWRRPEPQRRCASGLLSRCCLARLLPWWGELRCQMLSSGHRCCRL